MEQLGELGTAAYAVDNEKKKAVSWSPRVGLQADRKQRPRLPSLEERQRKGKQVDREILGSVTHVHEASQRQPTRRVQELEKDGQKQKRTLREKASSYEQSSGKESTLSHVNRRLKTIHKVTWADRCRGHLCTRCKSKEEIAPSEKGGTTEQSGKQGNILGSKNPAAPISAVHPGPLTYKEALLKQPLRQLSKATFQSSRARQAGGPSTAPLSFQSRCYRCLGRDHQVRDCRDPFRCVGATTQGTERAIAPASALSGRRQCRATEASDRTPRRCLYL